MRIAWILFAWLPYLLLSQPTYHQSKLDSLQKLINHSPHAERKVMLLLDQSKYLFYQNMVKEQEQILDLAIEVVEKTQNDSLKAVVYLKRGKPRLVYRDRNERMEVCCETAFRLAKELKDINLITQAKECQAALLPLNDEKLRLEVENDILEQKEQAGLSGFPLAVSYYNIGDISSRIGQTDTGYYYLFKALSIFKKIDLNDEVKIYLGMTYNVISDLYIENLAKYDTALLYADTALTMFNQMKAIPYENAVRATLSSVYINLAKYKEALENRKKIIANNGNKFLAGDDEAQLGFLSYQNGDYFEALEYFKSGHEKFKAANEYRNRVIQAMNIAFIYAKLGQHDKWLPYSKETLEIAQELGDSVIIGKVFDSTASGFSSLNNLQEAIKYRKKAMAIYQNMGNENRYYRQYKSIANCYQMLGQLDSAEFYNKPAFEYFVKRQDKPAIKEVYMINYLIASGRGEYQSALQNYEKANLYRDSIELEEAKMQLNKERTDMRVIAAKDKVAKAEEEKALIEREALLVAKQNQLYSILAFLLVAILLAGAYFFYQLRKSKRQIESQNLQLQQLNDTKDKFFGIIAHDVRSPIIALESVGSQMAYYLSKNQKDKLERLAGRVDSTAKRLSTLLDNLLNWALLQQGIIPYHPKALDVQTLAQQTLDMFRENAILKGVHLEAKIPEGIKVFADEPALQTILRNLVNNAIKFTHKGGTVSISTTQKEGKVFIDINDTGTGISASQLSKLFHLEKQSFKGTAGEKGTGLGLTLVKELVELNKGSVNVESEPEKGSNFRIGLPLVA